MNTKRHLNLFALATAALLVLGACSSTAIVPPNGIPAQSQAASNEPAPAAAASESDAVDQEVAAPAAPASSNPISPETAEPKTAVISLDGEVMVFDMWVCTSFGEEFLSGSGLPLQNAPADAEFSISYELPLTGDGENSEYDNTVAILFGDSTWKAGEITGIAPQEWGSLTWDREGDVLSGAATLEQSWGSDLGSTREMSFVVNCG